MRRLVSVLAAGVFVLSGCGALEPHDPSVTFYANGKTIRVEPTVYCKLDGTECVQKNMPAKLKVPVGKVVQISVDGEIADSLWTAVVEYESVDGKREQVYIGTKGRGEDYTYTLALPNATDRLLNVEVLQAAAAVFSTGEPPVRGTWSVEVTQ